MITNIANLMRSRRRGHRYAHEVRKEDPITLITTTELYDQIDAHGPKRPRAADDSYGFDDIH